MKDKELQEALDWLFNEGIQYARDGGATTALIAVFKSLEESGLSDENIGIALGGDIEKVKLTKDLLKQLPYQTLEDSFILEQQQNFITIADAFLPGVFEKEDVKDNDKVEVSYVLIETFTKGLKKGLQELIDNEKMGALERLANSNVPKEEIAETLEVPVDILNKLDKRI